MGNRSTTNITNSKKKNITKNTYIHAGKYTHTYTYTTIRNKQKTWRKYEYLNSCLLLLLINCKRISSKSRS